MAYTHFGARLARLGRFDSCTLYQSFAPVVQRTRTVGLHPTDAGSTPERRTTGFAGLARRSSPRSIIARCWFDSNILHHFVLSMGDWQRWLMHSPFKRDEVGSIPTSRTNITKRRHSITDECSELLPRMMRVQISLPLPR